MHPSLCRAAEVAAQAVTAVHLWVLVKAADVAISSASLSWPYLRLLVKAAVLACLSASLSRPGHCKAVQACDSFAERLSCFTCTCHVPFWHDLHVTSRVLQHGVACATVMSLLQMHTYQLSTMAYST